MAVGRLPRCVGVSTCTYGSYMAWQEHVADRNTFVSNRALVVNVVKYSLDGRLVIELKVDSYRTS